MSSDIRKKAFERYEESCEICGVEDSPIEIHHIDGDPSNNAVENLLPVCKECHSGIHSGTIEEWHEKILPRDERKRRVTYLLEPETQQELELIMHTADLNSEKEAVSHAAHEYNEVYETIQDYSSELPDELVKRPSDGTFEISESVKSVLEQHTKSAELVEEIRKDMARVVAQRLFDEEILVPDSDL